MKALNDWRMLALAGSVLVALACDGGNSPQNGAAQSITVTISPEAVSVLPSRPFAFTATVTGTTNTVVSWSVVEAGGGTIDAGGNYNAPANPGTYHVVAACAADPMVTATAIVTVSASAVQVVVSPGDVTVAPGNLLQFSAAVQNATDQSVSWSVEEGAAGGTVTSSGLYTAPTVPGTYHILAESNAESAPTATSTSLVATSSTSTTTLSSSSKGRGRGKITVQQTVAVSVSPSNASVSTGSTLALVATVSNTTNQAVTWSVQEGAAGGSITAAGVYTAPSTAGTYHVIATSNADTTKSATATISATTPPPPPSPAIAVSVAPATAAVATGGTVTFSATVSNSTNQAVTWAVQEGAAGGSVTSGGVYTAPSNAGTYHVVAKSQADGTAVATATVTVTAPPVSVSVSPIAVTVPSRGTQAFSAAVSNSTNQAVTWTVQEGAAGGSVTSAGVYTAPSTAGTYHVVATSQADTTKASTSTVTVSPPPIAVTINPVAATVAARGTQTFTATVTNATSTAVTWSVREGTAGGAITSAGVYTAPSTAGIYHVVATSQADNTKTATSTVTVTAPAITIAVSPTTASVTTGGSQTFTATVANTTNTAVTWTIQEGAAGGSITTAGDYRAPASAGTYHVVATSQADGSKSASAAVTVSAPPPPSGGGTAKRPSYNTGTGFFVWNGADTTTFTGCSSAHPCKLYDANGNEFRPYGVNKAHWSILDVAGTGIPNAKANAVRFWEPFFDGAVTAAQQRSYVQSFVTAGIVPMGCVYNISNLYNGNGWTTGQTDPEYLQRAVDDWIANMSMVQSFERYYLLNVANEWGDSYDMNGASGAAAWEAAYRSAVRRLRGVASGADCAGRTTNCNANPPFLGTIVVDSGNFGQDPATVDLQGPNLLADDPQHNVAFSVHLYANWGILGTGQVPGYDGKVGYRSGPGGASPWRYYALGNLAALNLPIVFGEVGHSPAESVLWSALDVISQAPSGLGWLAWSWDDVGAGYNLAVNLNTYNTTSDLTSWGQVFVENASFGMKNKAARATVFP